MTTKQIVTVDDVKNDKEHKKGLTQYVNIEKALVGLTIKDPRFPEVATDMAVKVRKGMKWYKEELNKYIKPAQDFVKSVKAAMKPEEDFLKRLDSGIKQKQIEYHNMIEAKAKKEREKEAERQKKAMERHEAKVEKAAEQGKEAPPMAPVIPRKIEPVKTIRTDAGSTTFIKVKNYRVIDINKVPKHFLRIELNAAAVRAAVNGGAEIPGIEVFEETRTAIRS